MGWSLVARPGGRTDRSTPTKTTPPCGECDVHFTKSNVWLTSEGTATDPNLVLDPSSSHRTIPPSRARRYCVANHPDEPAPPTKALSFPASRQPKPPGELRSCPFRPFRPRETGQGTLYITTQRSSAGPRRMTGHEAMRRVIRGPSSGRGPAPDRAGRTSGAAERGMSPPSCAAACLCPTLFPFIPLSRGAAWKREPMSGYPPNTRAPSQTGPWPGRSRQRFLKGE